MKRTIAFNALPESIINAQSKLLNKCKKIFSSSGNYLYGRENKQFERNLKRYFKTKYALTLASGHDDAFVKRMRRIENYFFSGNQSGKRNKNVSRKAHPH